MQTFRTLAIRLDFITRLIALASACLAVQAPQAWAQCANASNGPDLIASDLNYLGGSGSIDGNGNDTYGYSMTVLVCNIGNVLANAQSTTNLHPVFAMNFYRLATVQGAGRFEQIGMSWAAHVRSNDPPTVPVANPCCTCNGTFHPPLAPGCFVCVTHERSGNPSYLGPRSEVNAATGQIAYPYVLGWGQSGNEIYKNLQVRQVDMPPSSSSGNMYFAEAQFVAADDTLASNRNNNASYRVMNSYPFIGVPPGSGSYFAWVPGSVTQRTKPAIQAWRDTDPAVQIVNVDVPNDGRLIVAWKVTNTAPNLYHYEYAIQNLTSDRSVQAFEVPFSLMPGVDASAIGFHDIDYHSGEPYSPTDWAATIAGGRIAWAGDTFAANPNANALRWGTLYNFRFDTNAPPAPVPAHATVRLFKPSFPDEVDVLVQGPNSVDCNNNTVLDSQDIAAGASQDCNANGIPDECDLVAHDCNDNGLPDSCELAGHDCDGNGQHDSCQLNSQDCNADGIVDACELAGHDCNANGILDVCDLVTHDCNGNGIVDACELTGHDCDNNGTLDVCELATHDCNGNGIFDACELAGHDCNGNATLDVCELATHDCDGNGIVDNCELTGHDCDANGILDVCELATRDCNGDGIVDVCELNGHDCDNDGVHDSCQLAGNDADNNGVPDNCQPDCDDDGQIDAYEIMLGAEDCNGNGIPDTCDTNAPFTTSNPNTLIPDNNPTGIISSVLYPGGGNVTDVNVTVNIPHTAVSNLRITLRHGATIVVLWNNRCGIFDNLNVTFDDAGAFIDCSNLAGTYRPNSTGGMLLSAFNGLPAAGEWTLIVADAVANDSGRLQSWTLNITSTVPPPPDVNNNHVPDSCECLNCKGDGNLDGRIDGRDIARLVESIVGNRMNHCLDMDSSLTLNLTDVSLFVAAVMNPNPACAP